MGLVRRIRSMGGPMVLVGLGLAVSYAGFAADYYKHEIEGVASEVESIFAPVHIPIFLGMFLAGIGFLWAFLRSARPAAAPVA